MQMSSMWGALSALLLTVTAQKTSTFKPARPPSIPLAVRSPYLSTWFPAGSDGGNGGYLPGQWPTFWTGQVLGWTGLVRVDGRTSVWMGAPKNVPAANQTAFEYTSTKSIFTIVAGDTVKLKITFLSPIFPMDYKRQSLIFSYMSVDVTSLDGKNHDVQLYTDISAEWTTGDLGAKAEWSFGTTSDGINYHKVWRQDQDVFGESGDRAKWGSIYYAAESSQGLTHKSGADKDVRGAFSNGGKLDNGKDTNFRPINDRWPVFGYASDLGSVGSEMKSNLFSIGLCQENAAQLAFKDGIKTQTSLWKAYFKDDLEALSFFHKDFVTSIEMSGELDGKIAKDSKAAAGDNYATMTSLAVRQAFGGTQLVGTEEKHYMLLKEISSDGNTQTVDVIYPASPIFYYLNPELIRFMLDPLFENQEAGLYPHKYSMHDLGSHYPIATGHPNGKDEQMPLEECGNMIIMTLAYAQRTGNKDYVEQHYPLLKQWASFLIDEALLPADQLSTDDFAGRMKNQTNLALKGIIGIEAMSVMSKLVGEEEDADKFTRIAHDYIKRWEGLGVNKKANPPHAAITYNDMNTHGLLYNLYNDRLLNLSLVPKEIYDMQDKFYLTVKQKYGVPLDTRNKFYTKSDWEIFCAAIASKETRDMFVNGIAKFINETPTSKPFTDLYQTNNGLQPAADFKARPVQGGLFAMLLFDQGDSTPEQSQTDNDDASKAPSKATEDKRSAASVRFGLDLWACVCLFGLVMWWLM